MDTRKMLALLAVLGTVWGVAYMHDRANRYEVVAAGAGGGGTQDTAGDTEIRAFVIDRQTGKLWVSNGAFLIGVPAMKLKCTGDQIKSAMGCSDSPTQ